MESSKYSNSVSIVVSQMDVKLIFSATEPVLNEQGTVISEEREEIARIALSMPLAKRFNQILTASITNYEKQNGAIIELPGSESIEESDT